MSQRAFGRLGRFFTNLSLIKQFMIASFLVLVVEALSIGYWVGQEIQSRVIHQSGAAAALYVESFLAPHIQPLSKLEDLRDEDTAALNRLFQDPSFREKVAAIKIWGRGGRVLFSSEPGVAGQVYPVSDELNAAWKGSVSAEMSPLQKAENAVERQQFSALIEIYLPVRREESGEVIAVAEFYERADDLRGAILSAQLQSWLVVGVLTAAAYLLLVSIVQRAGQTITRQRVELSDHVAQLTSLLQKNDELHRRVQLAASRTAALNERYLRRISAELHDGPAQDVGLALLRLDRVIAQAGAATEAPDNDLSSIEQSLQRALQEVRQISAGLRLPELERLNLADSLERVARVHERRTGARVTMELLNLPADVPLPVKITLFRVAQEALTNGFRHGGGAGQTIRATLVDGGLLVVVADDGPGFCPDEMFATSAHLGLAGMRERVESLGGRFAVESAAGRGTRVVIRLPIQAAELVND